MTQKKSAGHTAEWIIGVPDKVRASEWFLADTEYGKVVLRALPEEYSFQFRTADETYFKREKIKRWMPLPDSEFIWPQEELVRVRTQRDELLEALKSQPSSMQAWRKEFSGGDEHQQTVVNTLIHNLKEAIRKAEGA